MKWFLNILMHLTLLFVQQKVFAVDGDKLPYIM